MAATNKSLGAFASAIKQGKPQHHPWNLISSRQIPYDAGKFEHSFRKGTMPTTVKLYPAILRAIQMYKGADLGTNSPDYLMVSKERIVRDATTGKPVREKAYFLELLFDNGESTIYHKHGNNIRISCMETDGTNNPAGEFKAMSEDVLAGVILLCLPEILEADASSKIKGRISDLEGFMSDFASWQTEADIPQLAKDSAFFMDAIFCYVNDTAQWKFSANDASAEADEVADTSKPFTGAVVVCSNSNVAFHYASSDGTVDGGLTSTVTIAQAKAEFSVFSKDRNWTEAEKMMIPSFPDDMPVMPETIRMAKRILGTRDSKNPVANMMWRGVTSYGKSTGVKQLACIFNVPLLILTCHPGMEISEFKSTFVPDSEEEEVEVDMSMVELSSPDGSPMDPNLEAAIRHVSSMEKEERKRFLSGTGFFMEAMMDTAGATEALLGKEAEMETEELCALYTQVVCYFREMPLRIQMESTKDDRKENEQKKKDGPAFKHVLSPYIKALINGYIVEIQELSRVRDSGVAVGINEYEKAGAIIHLMNGAIARRHKDAICVITDNVGYSSCRPIDPSVIRRQALIIDSYELDEEMLKDRVRRNTGCSHSMLDRCYELWAKVKEYCETNAITEGSVSPMELERFVQAVMVDGEDFLEQDFQDCVVSKATSSIEDQRDINTVCGLVPF